MSSVHRPQVTDLFPDNFLTMLHSHGRKRGMLLWIILMACSGLRAQDQLLTIQNLVDSALLHHPVLAQKQWLIESSKAAVTDTKSEYLPKLVAADQINIGSANNIRGITFPFAQSASVSAVIRESNKFDPASGHFASLYSEYTLADFGYRKALTETAEARLNISRADLERETYLVKLSICKLYLSILQKRNQLKTDAENKNRYQRIYEVIRAVTSSGIKPGVDSTLAMAEVAKATISYNQTRLALQQLYADLSLQTGIPAGNIALDSFTQVFTRMPVETFLLPGDTTDNPLIDIYTINKQALEADLQLTDKSYLPKVTVGAGVWGKGSSINGQDDYISLINGLGFQRFNYMAGVGISYDLFNGIRKRRKMQVSRFRLQALDQDIAFQKASLQNLATKATYAAQNARSILQQLPLQAKAAEQVYNQKLAQYRAGIADLIDLTNASFIVYRSQTDYIQALDDWYQNTLQKAAADGHLDQFIQKIK